MKKYNLTITERQAKLLIIALDVYTRVSVGQVGELNELIFEKDKNGIPFKIPEHILALLQKQMCPSLSGLNSSYGIHSDKIPDEIREGYDIFKILMYEFNKDKGIMNVYADKVRQVSKQELPKFKELKQ